MSTTLKQSDLIYVAGHKGMVGTAITKDLQDRGYTNLLTADSTTLDLSNQVAAHAFLNENKPDAVVVAAARVGGINANDTYPADFIYQNLMIECNLVHGAYQAGVKRLVMLGSSCIYPRLANQPMNETELLTGILEPTNEPYAVAKIAGIKLCESYNRQHGTDFRSLMPTNLYGPNDNFDLQNSHVIPALMAKFHAAKVEQQSTAKVWGSGRAQREFLHVSDMASASNHFLLMDKQAYHANVEPMQSHVNIGTGTDLTIRELAEQIAAVVGYPGHLEFDESMPDGTPVKRLDVALATKMGWQARVGLQEGLQQTYQWYLENVASRS